MVNQYNEPEIGRTIPVKYHLSGSGNEDTHLIDVPVSSSQGLRLRDVTNQLDRVRGEGMASMFSWSSKQRCEGKIVWHDHSEDDLINLFEGREYYLKGSMRVGLKDSPPPSSSRHETSENTDGRLMPMPIPIPSLPEDPELDRMLAGTMDFDPDDKQLIHLLLIKKFNSRQIGAGLIHEMNIYSTEPWNLAVRFELGKKKNEAFFFTSRQNVRSRAQPRPKGKEKVKRTAGEGFWHGKGDKSNIVFDSRWVSQKERLTFKMRDKSECPRWIMYEYLLLQQEDDVGTGFPPISIALCRIYPKEAPAPAPAPAPAANAEPLLPSLSPAPVATSTQEDGSHEVLNWEPTSSASPWNPNYGFINSLTSAWDSDLMKFDPQWDSDLGFSRLKLEDDTLPI